MKRGNNVDDMKTHNADAVNVVEEEMLALLHLADDELVEDLAADLLHPIKAEAQVDGQRDLQRLMSVQDVNPADHGSLVVRRATSVEPPCGLIAGELEGWIRPAVGQLCLRGSVRHRSSLERVQQKEACVQAGRRNGRR